MSLKVHVDRDRGSRTVSDKDKSKHSSSRYPVDLRSMLSSKDRRDRDRHESRDHREERRRDRRQSSSGGGDLRDRLDRYKDSDYRDHRDQHCEIPSSGKSKLLSMFLEDKNPEKDFKGKENGDLELQLESNRKAQKDLEKKLSNEWSERKKKKKKRSKSRSRDKDRKPLVNKESENRKRKLSPSIKTEKETSDESKPKKDKSRSKSRGDKDAKKKKKEKKAKEKEQKDIAAATAAISSTTSIAQQNPQVATVSGATAAAAAAGANSTSSTLGVQLSPVSGGDYHLREYSQEIIELQEMRMSPIPSIRHRFANSSKRDIAGGTANDHNFPPSFRIHRAGSGVYGGSSSSGKNQHHRRGQSSNGHHSDKHNKSKLIHQLKKGTSAVKAVLPQIKDVNIIDKYSRIIFPVSFLVFNIAYWCFYVLEV